MSVTWYILHVLRSSQIISLWCSCLGYIIITNDFCPSPWLFKAMSPYPRHPLQKRFREYCSRRSLLCLKDCTQPWVWFLMLHARIGGTVVFLSLFSLPGVKLPPTDLFKLYYHMPIGWSGHRRPITHQGSSQRGQLLDQLGSC